MRRSAIGGVQCYIATRQEKYRMRYLAEVVGLKSHFDGTFVTCDIGYDKSQPEYFEYVLRKLCLEPWEVLFFDDTQKNVDTARGFGINAYLYDNFNVLREQTVSILS